MSYGPNVNIKERKGKTPLYHAILRKKIKTVQLLLDNGADVDTLTNNGESPLYLAWSSCEIRIMKILLKAGAKMYPVSSIPYSENILRLLLKYSGINLIYSNKNIMTYRFLFDDQWKVLLEHFAETQALGVTVDFRILQTISMKKKVR